MILRPETVIIFNISVILFIDITFHTKSFASFLELWGKKKGRRTVTHAPVVVSHTVSMEKFWARFSHLTEVLVLLIHFTMVT